MGKVNPFPPWEGFFEPLDLYSYYILTTLYYFYTITPLLSPLHVSTHPPATSRELSSIFLYVNSVFLNLTTLSFLLHP